MRKTLLLTLLPIIICFSLIADEISFTSRESSVSLRDGREHVRLSGDASVSVGSLRISAESIDLNGSNWSVIECRGRVEIDDSERNLSIRTSMLYYDRESERLLISSYLELEDRSNELSARANHLEYDMQNEVLTLKGRVSFSKINNDDVIQGNAEMIRYDRANNTISLSGNCSVIYKGDEYKAERIELDIEHDSIRLESEIRGTING